MSAPEGYVLSRDGKRRFRCNPFDADLLIADQDRAHPARAPHQWVPETDEDRRRVWAEQDAP